MMLTVFRICWAAKNCTCGSARACSDFLKAARSIAWEKVPAYMGAEVIASTQRLRYHGGHDRTTLQIRIDWPDQLAFPN